MKNQNDSTLAPVPNRGLYLAALASLLLAAGCSSLPRDTATQLKDSAQLAADPTNEHARTFRAPTPLAPLGAVRVEPVMLAESAGELSPEQRVKLTARLAEALQKATAKRNAGAGEEVVITAQIVSVALGNTGANVASAALLGLGVDLGGVIVELEAHGAKSGVRIAAARYVEAGRPWQFSANFSAIGHALKGAEKAAERFGELLASK
jgi:hypothetical protein